MAPSRHRLMLGRRPRCAGAALEVVGLLSLRPQSIRSAFLASRSAKVGATLKGDRASNAAGGPLGGRCRASMRQGFVELLHLWG